MENNNNLNSKFTSSHARSSSTMPALRTASCVLRCRSMSVDSNSAPVTNVSYVYTNSRLKLNGSTKKTWVHAGSNKLVWGVLMQVRVYACWVRVSASASVMLCEWVRACAYVCLEAIKCRNVMFYCVYASVCKSSVHLCARVLWVCLCVGEYVCVRVCVSECVFVSRERVRVRVWVCLWAGECAFVSCKRACACTCLSFLWLLREVSPARECVRVSVWVCLSVCVYVCNSVRDRLLWKHVLVPHGGFFDQLSKCCAFDDSPRPSVQNSKIIRKKKKKTLINKQTPLSHTTQLRAHTRTHAQPYGEWKNHWKVSKWVITLTHDIALHTTYTRTRVANTKHRQPKRKRTYICQCSSVINN